MWIWVKSEWETLAAINLSLRDGKFIAPNWRVIDLPSLSGIWVVEGKQYF